MKAPKFIYSSSPDRGLDTLLCLWPFIRTEFPEAKLRIFYGFSNWEKSIKSGTVDEQSKRMYDDILSHIEQPGVENIGAVSQQRLAQEWKEADIWLYPTRFQETYCICALEAQLSKTIIVSTHLAGLIDTVADRGILIEGDAYTKEYREQALQETFLILRDTKRSEAFLKRGYEWAQHQTWTNRAKEWSDIFESRS